MARALSIDAFCVSVGESVAARGRRRHDESARNLDRIAVERNAGAEFAERVAKSLLGGAVSQSAGAPRRPTARWRVRRPTTTRTIETGKSESWLSVMLSAVRRVNRPMSLGSARKRFLAKPSCARRRWHG